MPSRRRTITDDLRRQIATGHFKAGERLPSEAQLATHYEVSTPTLRSALALLQGEGLLEKIHGSGNFVRHPLRRITYVGGGEPPYAHTEPLRLTIRTTTLQAHSHLTALLRVPFGSPLTEFHCLSHQGNSPHGLARIYVPRDLAPADSPEESPELLTTHLAELRPPLAEVQERLSARLPTPEEATALRISTSLAILAITRVATDVTGRAVEAALLVFPGDRADALFTAHPPTQEKTSRK